MLQFAYTILYVQNVEKTLAFYEAAFGFQRKFITPDNNYGELNVGNTTLSFVAITLMKEIIPAEIQVSSPQQKPFGMEVGFTTADVPAAVDNAVKAGATLVLEPVSKPWGQIVAYVRDINGFLVELCTPVTH